MDKQGLVVIAIILVAWVGYQTFVRGPQLRKYQEELAAWQEQQAAEAEAAAKRNGAAPVDSAGVGAPTTQTEVEAQPVAVAQHPHLPPIPFETDEHTLTLSTLGASVEALTFKKIKDTPYVALAAPGHDDHRAREPLRLLQPHEGVRARSFALEPLERSLVEAARGDWAYRPVPGGHEFSLLFSNGVKVVKTFKHPEKKAPANGGGDGEKDAHPYHFDLTVDVVNTTNREVDFGYRLFSSAGMVDDSGDARTGGLTAVAALKYRDREKFDISTLLASAAASTEAPDLKVDALDRPLTFYGVTTKYFASVVIPTFDKDATEFPIAGAEAQGLLQAEGRLPAAQDPLAKQVVAWGRTPFHKLAPGATRTDEYTIYVGPKQKAVFEAEGSPYAGKGLEKLVDYGWFEFMAKILLAVLKAFHWVVGNWGLAIIMLTFLVRSLLLPLSIWSQKNMLRMQKLAPELNKLKEKYTRKDGSMTPEAQRQFSVEQMELMRKTGVNPVGCIGPIFLQLPVFIGLWNALNYAFELRGQPFGLWIDDLSVPEVLFRLPDPLYLPLLGTDAVSVLPMIMIFTYWLQQKMQPVPTDPRAAEQAKMMKWILPVFGLMLYTSPSGLMLYFITSSLWSIVESKQVKKHIEKTEGPLPTGAAAPVMP